MSREIDMDVLKQIIGLAEDAMVRPFSKKKPEMLMEDDQEEEGEESGEEVEEEGEEKGEKSDISEEDLAELMEEYSKKGR